MNHFLKYVLFNLLLIIANKQAQALKLPGVISDNMVLQANAKVKLWGWGKAGSIIEMKPSWSVKSFSCKVGNDGKWVFKIRSPKASKREADIIFKDSEQTITVSHILLGEVWLCSGQSNMDFPVDKFTGWRTGILNEEKEMQDANFPEIRFFHVNQQLSPYQELDDCTGEWKVVTPENIKDFSAVAFFFGRKLYKNLNLPIGLIQSTWGGTPAESWTKMDVITHDPIYSPLLMTQQEAMSHYKADSLTYSQSEKNNSAEKGLKKPRNPTNNKTLSTLWNAMIHPLLNYSIKGVIWYQGESNAIRAEDYSKVFKNMIKSWRSEWEQKDLPFYFVQIAPQYKQPPTIREAQFEAFKQTKHTGMVVITDVGDSLNIHPRNKVVPGERLANWALAKTYNIKIPFSGPIFKSVEYKKNRAIVKFDYAKGGLIAQGNTKLKGFEIAGSDGIYHSASAKIKNSKVILETPLVTTPYGVRYGWDNFFRVNLSNTSGLPASPFRSSRL